MKIYMECSHCGVEAPDGARYCSQCGRSLGIHTAPVAAPVAQAAPPVDLPRAVPAAVPEPVILSESISAAPISPRPVAPSMQSQAPVKKKKYVKWLLIAAGVIILPFVAIAAAGMFASFFEASVMDEVDAQLNDTASVPVISADTYRSPGGRFFVNFPGAKPDQVQIYETEAPTAYSTFYSVDFGGYDFVVMELTFKQDLDPADYKTILEGWATGYAEDENGQMTASKYLDKPHLTLEIAIDGEERDIAAQMIMIDPVTAYSIEYSADQGTAPDMAAYAAFVNSFVYAGQAQ